MKIETREIIGRGLWILAVIIVMFSIFVVTLTIDNKNKGISKQFCENKDMLFYDWYWKEIGLEVQCLDKGSPYYNGSNILVFAGIKEYKGIWTYFDIYHIVYPFVVIMVLIILLMRGNKK